MLEMPGESSPFFHLKTSTPGMNPLPLLILVSSTPQPYREDYVLIFATAPLSRTRPLEATIRRIYPHDNWPEEGGVLVIMPLRFYVTAPSR